MQVTIVLLANRFWALSSKPVADSGSECAVPATLGEIARVVRSKNAGVNELTYDLSFESEQAYSMAKWVKVFSRTHCLAKNGLYAFHIIL